MKENSGEEYMLSPKVSRHANWGSIPCRKSARVQSRNREQEKSRNILKDCRAVADNQEKRKGLKIKLPMGNESEISLTSKLLGKRKKRNMHTNNSVIFLGERAVSPRGPNAVTLKQETISPDNIIRGNKEAEGAIDNEQAGFTRKDIKVQTSRNQSTEACETSPAMSTSMASDQNVQGAEIVFPDPQGYNDGQGDHFNCSGIIASLLQNAHTSKESPSSDMPLCVGVEGEKVVTLAKQELKGAPEKTFETHIPEETADGAGANTAAVLTSMPSEQDVPDAFVFLDSDLQGDNEEIGTYSPDRVSCKSFSPSLFHMASTFFETSSDATSSVDNNLKQVGSYRVSAEFALTLHVIIKKHGDIARNCRLTSTEMLKDILEKVCTAVQNLQQLPFSKLKEHHLASLNDFIFVAGSVNLDVEWLRHFHDEIRETGSNSSLQKSEN
ncbi:uncharacterized protein LOC142609874 [Castanea sativa]|uniref:uncharacterized protein LOC142609874 n=1 Tax=Castanea sativa TaxID=21020 RepID=UPI003F654668